MSIESLIQEFTQRVALIAWGVFGLSWAIGWALRGSPIPIYRVKRTGQGIVEDSIIGAFWLAIGTSVFALILYVTSNIS